MFSYIQGKGKGRPRTGHEGPEGEYSYGSTLPLTSALDGVGGQRHAPAALLPGKRPDGLEGRFVRVRKISPPLEYNPRTVQPVASRYTSYTIPALTFHHHHHVQEGLGLIPLPCILRMKLVPPSLPRSSYVSSSFWFIL
jgi:hypothetical protein